jgi:hypothetical protein
MIDRLENILTPPVSNVISSSTRICLATSKLKAVALCQC